MAATALSPTSAIAFRLAKMVTFHARGDQLKRGRHEIALGFENTPFGSLSSPSRSRTASASG